MGSGVAPDLLVTDKSSRRLPPTAGECHYSIVVILNYRDSVNFESRNLRFRHQPLLSSSKPQASQLKPSSKPGPGRRDEVIDRSYRFAERVSTRTRAADQPDGLSGVSRTTRVHATLISRGASRLDAFSGYPCPT